jgi:hypothetical protein
MGHQPPLLLAAATVAVGAATTGAANAKLRSKINKNSVQLFDTVLRLAGVFRIGLPSLGTIALSFELQRNLRSIIEGGVAQIV